MSSSVFEPFISETDSWVYLSDWIMVAVLGIGFIFYFSRLVGVLLSLVLRLTLWKHYKVHVSFGAFRLSPLGGRITATNFVVSTSDWTVSVLQLNLTWRYWLLSMVRVSEYFLRPETVASELPGLTGEQNRKLQSAVEVRLDGLEIFVYNRKAAYDNMVASLEKHAQKKGGATDDATATSDGQKSGLSEKPDHPAEPPGGAEKRRVSTFLRILPIGLRIRNCAVVIGNHTTPHILVASFPSAQAAVDLTRSPDAADKHRVKLDATMDRLQVAMKPNIAYDPDRYTRREPECKPHTRVKMQLKKSPYPFVSWAKKFLALLPFGRPESALKMPLEWHGLRRYVGDYKGEPAEEFYNGVEYAKYSVLLDTFAAQLVYYYDFPGVDPLGRQTEPRTHPQTGVDLTLTGGSINYGSWADRQRGALQALLFPPFAHDTDASDAVDTSTRQRWYAGFQIHVRAVDELVFRIPTREFSKHREPAPRTPTNTNPPRPFGWIEVTSAASEIKVFVSYVPTHAGFANTVAASLTDVEVRTSITHDLLFSADKHVIECDLGMPLQWNTACMWRFDMRSSGGVLFPLGEHITFFTDLVADFGAGPPPRHEVYRAFDYALTWTVLDYRVYLNVSDGNVFDDPLDSSANAYLCLQGPALDAQVRVPTRSNFSKHTTMLFSVRMPQPGVFLHVPQTHTVGAFMRGSKQVAAAALVELTGSYKAYSHVQIAQNNVMQLDVRANGVSVLLHGYVVRYAFAAKENYFGDFETFQSCDEYLQTSERVDEDASTDASDPDYWSHYKTEHDMHVLFACLVRRGLLVFPCQLYDHVHHIGVAFRTLAVDMHLVSAYMDLQVDFSSAHGHYFRPGALTDSEAVFSPDRYALLTRERAPEFLIDTFSVHSHRMLGVDLNTYQCKWDFAAGDVVVDGDPMCLTAVQEGLLVFSLGYKDYENTHRYCVSAEYDAANFSFRCPRIDAKLHTPAMDTYVRVCATDVLLSFNDIANMRYSDRIAVLLPHVIAEVVRHADGLRLLHAETSIVFNNICQKATMEEHRRRQQEHIRRNDAPTHRVPFLLFAENRDASYHDALGSHYPTVSLPTASVPLHGEGFYGDHASLGALSALDALNVMNASLSSPLNASLSASLTSSNTSLNSSLSLDSNAYLEPTTDYTDSEFMPRNSAVAGQQIDALIMELTPVRVVLTPSAVDSVSQMLLAAANFDLDFLMDLLQCLAVKGIVRLIRLVSVVTNVRVVCPTVDVRFTEAGFHDVAAMCTSAPPQPVLSVRITNPSVLASDLVINVRDNHHIRKETAAALALIVEHVEVSALRPGSGEPVFCVRVKTVEAWARCTGDKPAGNTSASDKRSSAATATAAAEIASCTCLAVEADVQQDLLEWSYRFFTLLVRQLEPALANLRTRSADATAWKKQLAYFLCPSADVLELQLDPKVITQPLRLHRLVIDHVRFFDSWKIVSKLRSLLGDVDYASANELFTSRRWNVPVDALGAVNSSFRRWRVWEGNMDQRRAFFESLFAHTSASPVPRTLLLELDALDVRLVGAHGCTDYVSVRDMSLGWTKREGQTELVARISECVVALSMRVLAVAELLQKLGSGAADDASRLVKSVAGEATVPKKQATSVSSSFLSFRLLVTLPQTHLSLNTRHMACNAQQGAQTLSVVVSVAQTSVALGLTNADHVTLSVKDFCIVSASATAKMPIAVIDTAVADVLIEVCDIDNGFRGFLRRMGEDVAQIQSHALFVAQADAAAVPTPILARIYPEWLLRLVVSRLLLFVNVLAPAELHLTVLDGSTEVAARGNAYVAHTGYRNVSLEVVVADVPIARAEFSRFGTLAQVEQVRDTWLVKSAVNAGYFKTSVQLLPNALQVLLVHRPVMEARVASLIEVFGNDPAAGLRGNKQEPRSSRVFPVAYCVLLDHEYCGFMTYREQCRYSAELEGISVSASNYDLETDGGGRIVPVFGDFVCRAARISVLDPLFDVGLSTVVDVNVSAKILNEAAELGQNIEAKAVQVVSEHFRVCFSPPVVFKALELLHSVRNLVMEHAGEPAAGQKMVTPRGSETASSSQQVTPPAPRKTSLVLSSLHILSYNLCIGWLFGGSHKDFPGFICGAERLFAMTKSDMGKLTMVGGYFSIANGSSASSFYSTASEMHALNRAYMQQLQVNYTVDAGRKLWVDVKGDQLDVRLMTNVRIAIERTMASIADVLRYVEVENTVAQMRSRLLGKPGSAPVSAKTRSFRPDLAGAEVRVGFAGSKVFFSRLQEDCDTYAPSSLTLHCPAVLGVTLYEINKERARKHTVRAEVLILESGNTLYPASVDVIGAFAQTFKGLLLPAPGQTARPDKNSSLHDVVRLLRDIDFHIGVRVEPQRVSLSCEPVAKVATVVEFDGVSLLFASGLRSADSVHALFTARGIAASLQHIYSDERSGTVSVLNVVFSSVVSLSKPVETYTSAAISGVRAHVKMKQYQDLDLFGDIWFPTDASHRLRHVAEGTKDAFRGLKEPPLVSALRVHLDFVVSNVCVDVDFGSALGSAGLSIDRAWAVSNQASAWHYGLDVGVHTLSVDCSGRLAGRLLLHKLLLRTSIQWHKARTHLLDVPLIHMSGDFVDVSLKVVFDDHVFAFVRLTSWLFDAYNHKNGMDVSRDHLFVSLAYEAVDVCFTSLSALDFYDIYVTVNRMIEQNRTLYHEILQDLTDKDVAGKPRAGPRPARKLDTQFELLTGLTRLLVFPHAFLDSRVFVLECDTSKVLFLQNETSLSIANQIELQLNRVLAFFTASPGATDAFVHGCSVDEFVAYARAARGGEILSLPRFIISMRTDQKSDTYHIEYMFQSSFSGTVNVRWNLGSVNCVREMYAAHKRALLSRMDAAHGLADSRSSAPNDPAGANLTSDPAQSDPTSYTGLEAGEIHKDFDKDIQDTLDKVTTMSRYTYSPLAPPIIEAPQLRELGNATPPLEWFGLNRSKFPDAVHQLAIVTLQQLIHKIEQQYSRTLGRADARSEVISGA